MIQPGIIWDIDQRDGVIGDRVIGDGLISDQ